MFSLIIIEKIGHEISRRNIRSYDFIVILFYLKENNYIECREPPGCGLGQIVLAVLQPGGIHIL